MKRKPKIKTRYISMGDLADYMGFHRNTIRRMIDDGRLPQPIRFSKTVVRFDLEQVEQQLGVNINIEQEA